MIHFQPKCIRECRFEHRVIHFFPQTRRAMGRTIRWIGASKCAIAHSFSRFPLNSGPLESEMCRPRNSARQRRGGGSEEVREVCVTALVAPQRYPLQNFRAGSLHHAHDPSGFRSPVLGVVAPRRVDQEGMRTASVRSRERRSWSRREGYRGCDRDLPAEALPLRIGAFRSATRGRGSSQLAPAGRVCARGAESPNPG